MLIKSTDGSIEIDDKYVNYSTYLREVGAYVPINTRCLKEYVTFLTGQHNFVLDDEVMEAFTLMGHPNRLEYPLDYFQIKLFDDWVRDNFYLHNLANEQDGLYGLIELPTVNGRERVGLSNILPTVNGRELYKDLFPGDQSTSEQFEDGSINNITALPKLPAKHYIAGGAALYVADITNNFLDVDIFTCDVDATKKYLHELRLDNRVLIKSGNSVSVFNRGVKYQFILREYTCPSEIIHGFDVGSSCIVTDGTRIWTTMRGYYSIAKQLNWFDPSRSSPTYAQRLSKYHMRGFNLILPLVDRVAIDTNVLDQTINAIVNDAFSLAKENRNNSRKWPNVMYTYNEMHDWFVKYNIDVPLDEWEGEASLEQIANQQSDKSFKNTIRDYDQLHYVQGSDLLNALITLRTEQSNYKLPDDPATLVVVCSCLGISANLWLDRRDQYMMSDYESSSCTKKFNINELDFKKNNPMSQVSSTFYPEPIKGSLIAWYKQSPLIIDRVTNNQTNPIDIVTPALNDETSYRRFNADTIDTLRNMAGL